MTARASSWYRDAIIYELHVKTFFDSSGDGTGDFRGLATKLDYLEALGITALWLLPFYPSPLRDDGYDIADYTGVHPAYGTLRDFREFLREAHRRGIRVITELVLNHTSDQHPWFQRARRAKPGSPHRDYYVWSDTPDRYRDARIIFKDFETSNWTWDPVARAYYWHRFYHHQPDLNFESPAVRRALFQAVDFWLELGVDGLRLDAAPYLYEQEGTSCENLPATHQFLKELRRHVDRKFPDRVLLAEANQWPEDAAAYFGAGDECQMAFHFPLMPRLFLALSMEDRFPLGDILEQTPTPPAGGQWALFLRNHDELTLEMVTDEERDHLWRFYAADAQARLNLGIRRRLAPLLGNNRRRLELLHSLLFSFPGTPVMYYGDELGMGDNVYLGDRNGVRTPMQWSPDRNAGFSTANPQRLYLPVITDPEYHYETVNVDAQQGNPSSLLWWMRRLIALRKRFPAFGRGEFEMLQPSNRKVLAFIRRHGEETILVAANLSRYSQYAELDLTPWRGVSPVELLGGAVFPAIGKFPYVLTFGPHSFYWFQLGQRSAPARVEPAPALAVTGRWDRVLAGPTRRQLENRLPEFLVRQRWFAGKSRRVTTARFREVLAPPDRGAPARIAIIRVQYDEGDPEDYVLPLTLATGAWAEKLARRNPGAILAELIVDGKPGLLCDAAADREFHRLIFGAIAERRRWRGLQGLGAGLRFPLLTAAVAPDELPRLLGTEQTNTSVAYGGNFVLKLFRKLEPGVNPELELGRFLMTRAPQVNIPRLAGAFEYRAGDAPAGTLALLHEFVPNQGSAWQYALDQLRDFLERSLARREAAPLPRPEGELFHPDGGAPSAAVREALGPCLESVRLLARRTAELHTALASATDPDFAPEPYTSLYQRSLYQSLRTRAGRVFAALRERLTGFSDPVRAEVEQALAVEKPILAEYRLLLRAPLAGRRIRCHGDYHLGQALFTGQDFVIMDFEGEPSRPLTERRLKRSPLKDVAGMIRSFHYATLTALAAAIAQGVVSPGMVPTAEAHLERWFRWTVAVFLDAYLAVPGLAPLLPSAPADVALLLRLHSFDKALYEIQYELNHRPDWLGIPIRGILMLAGSGGSPRKR